MKPILIDMQAFGPFAGRQVIDFRHLGDKRFFLIHGPTGSGKTSILDAMCFALFGDSSGGERDGAQMRSHHADTSTLTEVSFDFALGDDRYRVKRIPEQVRQAKKGGGETRQVPKAELFRLEVEDGAEKARPLATGWTQVTKKVGTLLGFESRQFRQVIVLPQGRFFEFLKSNSAEREAILQTLFGTEIYKRIEERLKTSAADVEREAAVVRTQRKTLLDQGQVPDEAQLDALVEQRAADLVARRNDEAASEKLARAAETTLADARKVVDRFDELDQASRALKALQAQEQEWTTKRGQLAAAIRAATIEPHADALAGLDRDLAAATTARDQRQSDLEAAIRRSVDANAALAHEQAREAERDEAGRQVDRLDALKVRVASLDAARAELKVAQAEASTARRNHEAAEKVSKSAAETLRRLEQTVNERRVQASQLEGLEAAFKRLDEQSKRVSNLAKVTEVLAKATREAGQQAEAAAAARQAVDRAKQERARVHAAWVAGQAARLAAELVAGEPCPVCGGRDHPAPARVAEALVQDEALDAAEMVLAKAENVLTAADKSLTEARQGIATQQARSEEIQSALGGASAATADELRPQIDGVNADLAKARAAAAALAGVDKQLGDTTTNTRRAELAAKQAAESAATAQARQQQREAIVGERQAEVPPELADAARLDAALTAATKSRDALRQALARATEAAATSATEKTRCTAQAESAVQALAALAQQRTAKAADLALRLQQAAFASIEAFRAARLDVAQAGALEQVIRAFDANLVAARQRHERATAGTREHQRPDVAALSASHEAAKAHRVAASNVVRDTVNAHNAAAALAATLKALAGQYQALQDRYAVLKKVADLATGNNGQRLSLQRYVLATLLEEVLAAATMRLRVMSRSRYELRRVEVPIDQRVAAGLDLQAFDHYTGTTRAVGTLSGGESFLASLALALGLSDVVQSYAGGIRLDAIFVDEGFGTLDAEALDFAIRALKDLQQAGRLVGIISHVGELREWIDARLEVKAATKGSVAEFRV